MNTGRPGDYEQATEKAAEPQGAGAVLRRRAVELARPLQDGKEADGLQVLEFVVGGLTYAMETDRIREVLQLKEVTPIPCTPGFILGIMNVRGRLLPVTELRKVLGVSAEHGDPSAVIILFHGAMEMGIAADAIIGVRILPFSHLQERVEVSETEAAYVKGLTPDRTAVLDADAILSDRRLIVNDEALR